MEQATQETNAAISVQAKFTDRQLHIEQLRFAAKHNARPEGDTPEPGSDDEDEPEDLPGAMPMPLLIGTIEAVGLILPLIVVDLHRVEKGRALYAVAAGGRRLRALLTLWKSKRLADPMIACREVERAEPLLISLIENMARQSMHAADECVAFAELVAAGKSVETVAAAFSVDVRHVHQRLALSKLHPQLLAEFRQRKFGLAVAKAFTCEPDLARQLAVWKKLAAYQRNNPHFVRDALTEQDMTAGDRLARFVGVDAYRGAGGEVREDLFAEAGSPQAFILADPGLVESLAAAKLQDKAEAMVAQGWAWAEPTQAAHCYDVSKLAQSRGLLRVEARGVDRAQAGYFVYCDQSGNMQIEGPYRPKKDAKAQERKKGANGEAGAAEVRMPESLMTSLTAHKSAGLQCALLKNPRVTLALLASNIVASLSSRYHLDVSFGAQGFAIERSARGYEQTAPAAVLAEADKAWESRIPGDVEPLSWFLEQPEAVSIEAIVWGTARAFSIINGRDGSPHGVAEIERALGFTMADYFKPTAQSYLGQIPKAKIIEAVTEALGAAAAAPLESMQKGELAAAAEAKLAETAWVPQAIR